MQLHLAGALTMGLFDAYDPATYQDSQSGLLDRLLASVNAAPTDPGPGFAPLPMDANAAIPAAPAPQPQQASPIAVGDYSMPRIGPAAAFTLPPGQLDPATGEHVAPAAPAPAPVQQPAAPAPSNPFSGFLNRAADGLDSVAHGGTLLAAIRGQPNDARSVKQRELQQQFDAYVGAGISPQIARIAVLNPEAGKALIAQQFGPPQAAPQYAWDPKTGKAVHLYEPEQKDNFSVVQTGEDGLGKKTFQKMNKATGETTPIAGAPGADANSGGLGDMSKTGDAYLATLPPQQAGIVKAMVEGRQPSPSSFAMSKPYWQNMLQAAQIYDPTFDATNWSGRVAGVRDFSAGKSSEMVRSANQTLQHVNALIDSAEALHNGNYPSLNWAGNKINEATGGGEPGAFLTNAHAVADEMGKVFKGANLSDSEIHAWADALSPNMSPAQQRAQIGKMTELLHGALEALDEKRVASIGQVAADKAGPIIKPEGQKVLQRIDAWLKAGGGASGTAGGTAPTGVKWSVVQ
jgi:hypothetical protein